MADKPEQLLEVILKALVDEPDKVKIARKVDEMGVLLTVKVGDEDVGLVIGKKGMLIQAIRTVISTLGMKNKARVHIKLDVPEIPRRRERRPIDLSSGFE